MRRERSLPVRLSDEEWGTLSQRANACGMPPSTYMRTAALGSIPRSRPRAVEREAVYHLGRIGNNLNQLARAANTSGELVSEERLRDALHEVLEAVRRLG